MARVQLLGMVVKERRDDPGDQWRRLRWCSWETFAPCWMYQVLEGPRSGWLLPFLEIKWFGPMKVFGALKWSYSMRVANFMAT